VDRKINLGGTANNESHYPSQASLLGTVFFIVPGEIEKSEHEGGAKMNEKLKEIGLRMKGLRDIFDMTPEEVAHSAGMEVQEYLGYEAGECDFSFTALYNVAKVFHVDITELLTGESPKLSRFCVIRRGEGLPMQRRKGFDYQHLAFLLKEKISEPFLVTAPYDEEADKLPLHLNYHEGQEFDYILEGSLKVRIDNSEFVLNAGDSVYYDSSHGHGMVATNGAPCKFLAIVMKYATKEEHK
jgi:mannose-6-phosphate isomerase-like protein (cupin superfamily)